MLDPNLMRRAIARIAEERIREAEERGVFDNLPGQGKPFKNLDEQAQANHELLWFRAWMERERLMGGGKRGT